MTSQKVRLNLLSRLNERVQLTISTCGRRWRNGRKHFRWFMSVQDLFVKEEPKVVWAMLGLKVLSRYLVCSCFNSATQLLSLRRSFICWRTKEWWRMPILERRHFLSFALYLWCQEEEPKVTWVIVALKVLSRFLVCSCFNSASQLRSLHRNV